MDDDDNQLRILTGACNAAISLLQYEPSSNGLEPCGPGVVELHRAITRSLGRRLPVLRSLILRANDLLRLSTTKLNAFPYHDVPLCWRRLYTDASILKAVAQINLLIEQGGDDLEIVETLDMALIMTGAPGSDRRRTIEELLRELDIFSIGVDTLNKRLSAKKQKQYSTDLIPSYLPPAPKIVCPIDRLCEPPSLERFQSYLNGANTPMIIQNLITHWPALGDRQWSSTSYLLSKTHQGKRLVPVELGKSYTTADWGQKIMTFKEFMDSYVLDSGSDQNFQADGEGKEVSVEDSPKTRPIGYLAQHTLFAQIPELRNDIMIPDYCYTSPPPPPSTITPPAQLEDPLVNAWFGPSGTISPLHTDPYCNILTQVLGRKYVRLYAPSETPKLFPRGKEGNGVDMSNTSYVDINDEEMAGLGDKSKYEEWREAQYVEGVLEVGEGLYIPAGWWHYVKSLDTSFSVSFWWN